MSYKISVNCARDFYSFHLIKHSWDLHGLELISLVQLLIISISIGVIAGSMQMQIAPMLLPWGIN